MSETTELEGMNLKNGPSDLAKDMARYLPKIKKYIDDHVRHRLPLGRLTRSVLANDLHMTVLAAYPDEFEHLKLISQYVVMFVPDECKDSYQKIDDWTAGPERSKAPII